MMTLPRLNPCQLPCVGKWLSSNPASPMRCICASNNGISSTRSVVMLTASFMLSAYQNLWTASTLTRTVSTKAIDLGELLRCTLHIITLTFCNTYLIVLADPISVFVLEQTP